MSYPVLGWGTVPDPSSRPGTTRPRSPEKPGGASDPQARSRHTPRLTTNERGGGGHGSVRRSTLCGVPRTQGAAEQTRGRRVLLGAMILARAAITRVEARVRPRLLQAATGSLRSDPVALPGRASPRPVTVAEELRRADPRLIGRTAAALLQIQASTPAYRKRRALRTDRQRARE